MVIPKTNINTAAVAKIHFRGEIGWLNDRSAICHVQPDNAPVHVQNAMVGQATKTWNDGMVAMIRGKKNAVGLFQPANRSAW